MGIGTLCTRQKTLQIGKIIKIIKNNLPGWVKLHGFGIKLSYIKKGNFFQNLLYSADSMSWSLEARYYGKRLIDSKNNCLLYNISCKSKAKDCHNCGYYLRNWSIKMNKLIEEDKFEW